MIGTALDKNSAKPNINGTEDSDGLYNNPFKYLCPPLLICNSLKALPPQYRGQSGVTLLLAIAILNSRRIFKVRTYSENPVNTEI